MTDKETIEVLSMHVKESAELLGKALGWPEEDWRLLAGVKKIIQERQEAVELLGDALGTDPELRTLEGCAKAAVIHLGHLRDDLAEERRVLRRKENQLETAAGAYVVVTDLTEMLSEELGVEVNQENLIATIKEQLLHLDSLRRENAELQGQIGSEG